MSPEDQEKVDAFIKARGVTKCPGMFSPELMQVHKERAAIFAALSPGEKQKFIHNTRKKAGRPKSNLTAVEKKAKHKALQRQWYQKNKHMRQAYEKIKWQIKKAANAERKAAKQKALEDSTQQ